MAKEHTVKQGESIANIAFVYGFFPDTIWDLPENKALKEKRQNPDVLLPGDVVFVPDKRVKEVSLPPNRTHKFKCRNTPKTFRVQLLRQNRPVPDMAYDIEVDGWKKKGTTSGGWIIENIPPNSRKAVIILEEGLTYKMELGYLDPPEEISGIQGRLRTLGYYKGPVNGIMEESTTEALKIFQHSNKLEVTGIVDEPTRSLLKDVAGT
jgi:hypothetical protein